MKSFQISVKFSNYTFSNTVSPTISIKRKKIGTKLLIMVSKTSLEASLYMQLIFFKASFLRKLCKHRVNW